MNARNESGRTPLHHAAWTGQVGVIDLLLAAGADVNAPDLNGSTSLHYAACAGRVQVIDALLAAGADVSATDSWGDTPLQYANENYHTDAVLTLLDALLSDDAQITADALFEFLKRGDVEAVAKWKTYDTGAVPEVVPKLDGTLGETDE